MNEKLADIGEKLRISKQDIRKIQERRPPTRIGKAKWFLFALISAASFLLGILTGRASLPPKYTGGYPYAAGVGASTGSSDRGIWTSIVPILLPILTFLLGFGVGRVIGPYTYPYPQNIMYGVYGKGKNEKRSFKALPRGQIVSRS